MNIFENDSEKGSGKSKNFKERIQEQFLNNRQIFLWGAVTDKSSEDVIEKMMYLESKEPGSPIYFFINSPGGVISSGMAVFDIMHMISSPVYTITMGMAASMGAMLFSAGEKGHRYMFPHARVMIHQPLISGQIVAPAIDIKIHAEEIKKTKNELNRILAGNTGKTLAEIERDTDRDYWMNAEEAISYGIADHTLDSLSVFNLNPDKTTSKAAAVKPAGKTAPEKKKTTKPK